MKNLLRGFAALATALALQFGHAGTLPGPLVDAKWLAANLDKVQVVDVRGNVKSFTTTPEFETENRDWVAYAVDDGIFQRGRPADLYTFIPDLNNADRFDTLAGMLSRRGHSDARIAKVLGENFARVMTDVWG